MNTCTIEAPVKTSRLRQLDGGGTRLGQRPSGRTAGWKKLLVGPVAQTSLKLDGWFKKRLGSLNGQSSSSGSKYRTAGWKKL